jgi:hypothetical protein
MEETVRSLVERYERNRAHLLRSNSQYLEADVRAEFIDPLFSALGWDLTNARGVDRHLREVRREHRVGAGGPDERPDYEFRLAGERRFFVEAKTPTVDLRNSSQAAFQIRRYGWSAGLWISVITNFEHLAIYETTQEPSDAQPPHHSRLHLFHYSEYGARWSEIAGMLSRQTVYSGDFDEVFGQAVRAHATQTIDQFFLRQLNEWRLLLAQDLLIAAPELDLGTLNEIVQRFLLRIMFLRMCEDRGLETRNQLWDVAQSNSWDRFANVMATADRRFDTSLFDGARDSLASLGRGSVRLNSQTVAAILESLYFPAAPYSFAVFEPEFLGFVYEQFLRDRVVVDSGRPLLRPKPENQDRDVVATPPQIIERIVRETLVEPTRGCTAEHLLTLKVLDPACGSGGFLIAAFEAMCDSLIAAYERTGDTSAVFKSADGSQLVFAQKCNLLTHCIYGADRDQLAVEVSRFSLLLKLLDGESSDSLPLGSHILPSLDANVVLGDSLVDRRIFETAPDAETIGPPLTWGVDLPGTYAFVVGNPPYVKTESMLNLEPSEYAFYTRHYASAYKQFDKYYVFLERAVRDLLSPGGRLGVIVSRKFTHLESGRRLRAILSRDCEVQTIIDFGSGQVFTGRSTYTCMLFARKNDGIAVMSAGVPVQYLLVTTPRKWVSGQTHEEAFMALPRRLVSGERSWLLPATQMELELVEALLRNSVQLGQVADIFNGVQTSRNDVYVIKVWFPDGPEHLVFTVDGRSWRVEKAATRPFFDRTSALLKPFYPVRSSAVAIFPYDVVREGSRVSARFVRYSEMERRFPLTLEWLCHNRRHLDSPPRDVRPAPIQADEWYRYGRDQALTAFEGRAKIVVGVNSQGDKYGYDISGMLLASGGTAGECAISEKPGSAEGESYSLHFILALLNHKAVEYYCRKRGSPFRGGWYARGTAVLNEVPIPEMNFEHGGNPRLSLYRRIVDASKEMCSLALEDERTAATARKTTLARRMVDLKQRMDTEISDLYGILGIVDQVVLPE